MTERRLIVSDGEDTHLLTRRDALRAGACALAAATALVALPDAAAEARTRLRFATKGWRRSRFEPHVGTTVKLRPLGAPAVRVKLVAVEDLGGESVKHLAGSQHAYALRFRGPRSLVIGQATVGIRHPRFGVVRVFVTPSRAADGAPEYVAIVNRVVPRAARAARSRAVRR